MESALIEYLVNVAPVALVLGFVAWELWRHNRELVERGHARDLENLRTLEQMLAALKQLETRGETNHAALKAHISERVDSLRARLHE